MSEIDTLHEKILSRIAERYPDWRECSKDIHEHPEVSNHEHFACKRLSELLAREGFSVKTDVAGHPTGFTAVYKSAKPGPVLVFLAEYDALPGLGHGCGHNLFGATSSLAAVGLKAVIDETGGEVRVYGTPGEEGGENGSAKGSFVREGFFKDVDAALCTHPGSLGHHLTAPNIACAPVSIEFFGKSAHAASMPEKGINALDGVILTYNGINAMRQHVTSDVRIHGIITDGGKAPNIVPDYARAYFYLRAATVPKLDDIIARVKKIVEGAALMTGARSEMKFTQNRVDNLVPTPLFDEVYKKHLLEAGETLNTVKLNSVASSDVGNVSQVVPTIQPWIKISDHKLTPHTEGFKEAAISECGLASIKLGARLLAFTALDLILDPDLLARIKAEHAKCVANQ
jgi:amidohydrolase